VNGAGRDTLPTSSPNGLSSPALKTRTGVGVDLPVKVLHVAETLTGGIASYFEEMIPAQCGRLGASAVAALAPRAQIDQIQGLGQGHTVDFPSPNSRALRSVILFWYLLLTCIRTRPRIIHAHSTIAGVVARVVNAMLLGRMKVVYCAHGWAWDRDAKPWVVKAITWVEWLLSPLSQFIVCISRHDHEAALKVGISPSRLKLISNGIADLDPMRPEDHAFASQLKRRNFLFVGRFDQQKGIDIFMSAMRDLEGEATAYAVGGYVVDSGNELIWPKNVKQEGWTTRSRVAAYMSRVDALVVPSRWEGFGLVALEAMRAGLPVIASDVGGLKDLVEDGVSGFLFDPEQAGSLAEAMRKAMSADMVAMGRAGRERFVRSHLSDAMNSELLKLYNDLSED
jgi:glycosyltransferase involved in cell wall biosynthesis